MTWTHTPRGRALDLLDPQPEDIDLDEIAAALGRQCRYAGNIRGFYSVAEHSVLICQWLLEATRDPALALAGLLHDAAEAYTGDITYPMQSVLWYGDDEASRVVRRRYRDVQRRLDLLITARVDLDPELLHCAAVKTADLRILLDERRALLTEPPPRPWMVESELGLSPLGVQIQGWQPDHAAARFRAVLQLVRGVRP